MRCEVDGCDRAAVIHLRKLSGAAYRVAHFCEEHGPDPVASQDDEFDMISDTLTSSHFHAEIKLTDGWIKRPSVCEQSTEELVPLLLRVVFEAKQRSDQGWGLAAIARCDANWAAKGLRAVLEGHPAKDLRFGAAIRLAELGSPDGVALLRDQMTATDMKYLMPAVFALERLKDELGVRRLQQLIHEYDGLSQDDRRYLMRRLCRAFGLRGEEEFVLHQALRRLRARSRNRDDDKPF